MENEQVVAGLRCREVLELLPEYIDETLSETAKLQVDQHLRGCRWCSRFGGRYAELVSRLQKDLGPPEPIDPQIEAKLDTLLSPRRDPG